MIYKKRHIDKLYELTQEKEEWSTIPEYEGYLVSTLGRVWSATKNDIMNGEMTEKGYLRVALKNAEGKLKKIRVHRLVAELFLPNPENKTQVDHKNGVKIDNRLINLRWLSNQENQIAAVKKGGRKTKTNGAARYRLKKRKEKFEEQRAKEIEERNASHGTRT